MRLLTQGNPKEATARGASSRAAAQRSPLNILQDPDADERGQSANHGGTEFKQSLQYSRPCPGRLELLPASGRKPLWVGVESSKATVVDVTCGTWFPGQTRRSGSLDVSVFAAVRALRSWGIIPQRSHL